MPTKYQKPKFKNSIYLNIDKIWWPIYYYSW